jgi:hypothetical protein
MMFHDGGGVLMLALKRRWYSIEDGKRLEAGQKPEGVCDGTSGSEVAPITAGILPCHPPAPTEYRQA